MAQPLCQGAYVIGGSPTAANFNANGMTFFPVAEVNGGTSFTPALTGNIFHFITNASFGLLTNPNFRVDGSAPDNEFYLNVVEANPVPVPSAFILFGTGLVGLIGWNYRRAKK